MNMQIICIDCPAGAVCSTTTWVPSATKAIVSSAITCGPGTFRNPDMTATSSPCAACLTTATCLYGVLHCNAGYFNAGGACMTCPSSNAVYCDNDGFTCCAGFFPSDDGVSCKACPTSDISGTFNEANVATCDPTGKTCLSGVTYNDKCYPSNYLYTLSSSVLAYTSMMIVAVILAMF